MDKIQMKTMVGNLRFTYNVTGNNLKIKWVKGENVTEMWVVQDEDGKTVSPEDARHPDEYHVTK